MTKRLIACLASALALAACPSPKQAQDAGIEPERDAAVRMDGGELDQDSGQPSDSGTGDRDAGSTTGPPSASRSIAISADGRSLWVVNTESDSISEIDVAGRRLSREILLASPAPAVDPLTGRFDPRVRPRAIALVESLGKIYVAAQAANRIIIVDIARGVVTGSIAVGAEPTSVVVTRDASSAFVVNHQSGTVQKIDAHTDRVTATVSIAEHPWGASLAADESILYVSHLLTNPGVTTIRTATLGLARFTAIPKLDPDASSNKLIPNGEARGAYAAVPRPNNGEVWVPHLLLATDTPQPALDFQSTVFPTISVLSAATSTLGRRLNLRPSTVLTFPGAFIDVISGPRDVAFTPDGKIALVANAQSEDVLVFDAEAHLEVALVRPTPSSLIEGVIVDSTGTRAYLQGRGTHNVTMLAIAESDRGTAISVDGAPIECLAGPDPMPQDMRRGQRLFYSSNSAAFPVTQNFWVACATCHLEGQTDAVVWKFKQGPRDTPSNAGGPINTGFLFRQAMRNDVIDYDETIRVEQGGGYHRTSAAQLPDLQALAKFTNYAIPFPQNPNLGADGSLSDSEQRGKTLFEASCTSCHSGPYLTDSGTMNPSLDLSGTIVLHDIGTCVTTGPYPDKSSTDIDGHPRDACQFDTPTLRAIFSSPPYFHDGSAATLEDAVARVPSAGGFSAQDRTDVVAYLKTL